MSILVTGAAGFIGMHTAKALLARGEHVIGIDNLNDYYDPNLKLARLAQLKDEANFVFEKMDIADMPALEGIFARYKIDRVINLAAQAGVRYSITNPLAYGHSNLTGFLNILEASRRHEVNHLVYASSSSVYGGNTKMPFSETDPVDRPVSLYAATKKANELMAHTYSHLYKLPTTGLRFFTVYGPWGRPDMAYFSFVKDILDGKEIKVFNYGNCRRDFTYVDDIVEGVVRVLNSAPAEDEVSPYYRVFNIGNSQPVNLLDFIRCIEMELGMEAKKIFMEPQPGDVEATFADVSSLEELINFRPEKPLQQGIAEFVNWYTRYHG